jgi:sigma-B regulation protein RsbU (phosphoserine phosphatase)
VVDGDRRPVGIIVPRDLVDILGKPFGRDLLKRQRVEDIMREATSRRHDEHVQELLARVDADPDAPPDENFVLVDGDGRFCGHVTSHDLVVHATVEHRRELETATRIQRRLVSPSFSVLGKRVSITCASVMAQGVGGDYYYAREYQDGRWFFCLCDISGKGISAAIVTAVLASFLRDADLERPLETPSRF